MPTSSSFKFAALLAGVASAAAKGWDCDSMLVTCAIHYLLRRAECRKHDQHVKTTQKIPPLSRPHTHIVAALKNFGGCFTWALDRTTPSFDILVERSISASLPHSYPSRAIYIAAWIPHDAPCLSSLSCPEGCAEMAAMGREKKGNPTLSIFFFLPPLGDSKKIETGRWGYSRHVLNTASSQHRGLRHS